MYNYNYNIKINTNLITKEKIRFSTQMVASIIKDVISAVYFLHNHNIVHRDIKPDNFVMGSGKLNYKLLINNGLFAK